MAVSKPARVVLRFVLLASLSVGMMIADYRSHYLQNVRAGLAILVTPVQLIATVPERVGDWLGDLFAGHEQLLSRNKMLERDQVTLKARLQRLRTVEEENDRLRQLLAASKRVPDKVLMAELVEVSLDPYNHKILLNRGLNNGAQLEQPVLDPDGVMGQLTQVMPFNSVVTLITDPSHATPVQVSRNGVRAVAFGVGKIDRLQINYLTPNADIKVDDVLVTSGLGGRFPSGYPVARVKKIDLEPGAAFLSIRATPIAKLDRARHVLLLLHGNQTHPKLNNRSGGAGAAITDITSSNPAQERIEDRKKGAANNEKRATGGDQR